MNNSTNYATEVLPTDPVGSEYLTQFPNRFHHDEPSSRESSPDDAAVPLPAPLPPPPPPQQGANSWIPRPRNAFIIFRCSYSKAHAGRPTSDNRSMSKRASDAWKQLTPRIKQQYKFLADIERIDHQLLYPNYVYKPNRQSSVQRPGSHRRSNSSPLLQRVSGGNLQRSRSLAMLTRSSTGPACNQQPTPLASLSALNTLTYQPTTNYVVTPPPSSPSSVTPPLLVSPLTAVASSLENFTVHSPATTDSPQQPGTPNSVLSSRSAYQWPDISPPASVPQSPISAFQYTPQFVSASAGGDLALQRRGSDSSGFYSLANQSIEPFISEAAALEQYEIGISGSNTPAAAAAQEGVMTEEQLFAAFINPDGDS